MKWGYFGTDEFSSRVLALLLKKGERPHLVITAPDKPRGRGRKPKPSPVKKLAEESGLTVHTPEKLTREVCQWLAEECEFFLLCSYGKIIPARLLEERNVYNLHPSLLPKYRGASPIRAALFNGDRVTGVCVIKTVKELDAGDIWKSVEVEIENTDDFTSLSQKLSAAGGELLSGLLQKLRKGEKIEWHPQKGTPTYAPKLTKGDLLVNWGMRGKEVVNKIRGLSRDPGASAFLNGEKVKLFAPAFWRQCNSSSPPGTVLKVDKEGAWVSTEEGCAVISVMQLPCRKPCSAWDLFNCKKLLPGMRFE